MAKNTIESPGLHKDRVVPEGFSINQVRQLKRLIGGGAISYEKTSEANAVDCPIKLNTNVTVGEAKKNRVLIKEVYDSISKVGDHRSDANKINIVLGDKTKILEIIEWRKEMDIQEINVIFDLGDDTAETLKKMGYIVNTGFPMDRVTQFYYRIGQIDIEQYNTATQFLKSHASPENAVI